MKDIQYYLQIMRENKPFDRSYLKKYDLFDMQILDSCMYTYSYNYRKDYYNGLVFESHSIFNKCREITEFIVFILKHYNLDKESSITFLCNDIDEIKNDYFNVIYLYCDVNDNNKAEYSAPNDKNILKDNKFDYIFINVDINLPIDSLYDKIEHELTHAYEDLQRHINKVDSLYLKSIKDKYYNLEKLDTDSKELKDVKNLLYLLDKSEQNAYMAQFDGILGQEPIKHIQKAYNKIYNSKLYKDIKSFSYLVTNKDQETQELLCDLYRKIYDSKETNNKILKRIYKEWDRFLEHFRRNIYQCVCDRVNKCPHRFNSGIGDETIKDNTEEKLKEKIDKEYINKSIFIEK